MTTLDPRSFLATVGGYLARDQDGVSSNRPIKLATVDPAYTGSGSPQVTFDGETVLSSKHYAFVDSYRPTAGDRVALIPVGTTYLIAGRIDNSATGHPVRTVNLQAASSSSSADLTLTSAAYADVAGCSITVSTRNANAIAVVTGVFWFQATAAGASGDTMTGSLNVDGTIFVPPEQSTETSAAYRPGTSTSGTPNGTFTQVWRPILPTPGNHTLKLQAKRSGGTGTFACRSPHTSIAVLLLDL